MFETIKGFIMKRVKRTVNDNTVKDGHKCAKLTRIPLDTKITKIILTYSND